MDKDAVKEVFLPNREDCFKFLRKKRWDEKGGVKCLYCLSQNIHHNGYTTKGARKYKCCECGKYFNDLTGTIFENRRFFIEEMFYIIKEMETKSALQISEELGRDYDSVLNFIHKVHLLAYLVLGDKNLFSLQSFLSHPQQVLKDQKGLCLS